MKKIFLLAILFGGMMMFGWVDSASAHGGCGPYNGGGYYGGGYYGGYGYGSPGIRIDLGYGRPYGYYGRPWGGARYYRGYYRDRYYGRRGYYGYRGGY